MSSKIISAGQCPANYFLPDNVQQIFLLDIVRQKIKISARQCPAKFFSAGQYLAKVKKSLPDSIRIKGFYFMAIFATKFPTIWYVKVCILLTVSHTLLHGLKQPR